MTSDEAQKRTNYYDVHVFCCINARRDGHPRGCCAAKGAQALRDYMKKRGKELRINRLRVNESGCLDRCELGPTMVIYPEGTWYHYETEADVDEILTRHVMAGEIVPHLVLHPYMTAFETAAPSETGAARDIRAIKPMR